MPAQFHHQVQQLRKVANHFDAESQQRKLSLIDSISGKKIVFSKSLTDYFECLLFILAFPPDRKTEKQAEQEIVRMAAALKKQPASVRERFVGSGIPFMMYRSAYSHDCTRWLLSHPDCTVAIHSIEDTLFDLNAALKVTLPPPLRSATTAGLSSQDLLDELMPDRKRQLRFIVNELSRLDATPYIKDHFYEGLRIYLDVTPKNKRLSKVYNRIRIPETFYHNELVTHVDVAELLNRELPAETILTEAERKDLIRIIKNSMLVTDRETDPATFMKEDTLRLFHLERGVSVALYGMPAERQLPMESYIGYTMFKNGYPAAYAGGWVFGHRSDFGLNIYDQFRGGESAFMVAQVLRVYRQLFEITHFQVEASQFGLDNPEGIQTGVFWFYYKLGFRPNTASLRQLATSERKKMASRKGYRSSEKTLLTFTESNISLHLRKSVQASVYDITAKVKQLITNKYKGDSTAAEQACTAAFLTKTKCKLAFSGAESEVLKEVSLWAAALNITRQHELQLLLACVQLKPVDEYRYQEKLRQFFGQTQL
jgi:hypothetical protein